MAIGAVLLGLGGCAGRRPAPLPDASPGLLAPALRVDEWSFEGRPGLLIRTRSYRLYTTVTDGDLLAALPPFLERALDAYTTLLGPLPRPQRPLDTFLMADREQWAALTRQVMGGRAPEYLRIERGGFAGGGRAVLWALGPRDTFVIAAHEGWHQYTQRAFEDALPPWLEEGVAVFMEGVAPDPAEPTRFVIAPRHNPERLDQLRRAAARGELAPLAALLEGSPEASLAESPEAALTFYAQAWALVLYLKDGADGARAPALERLLADAAAGRLRGGNAGTGHGDDAAGPGRAVFEAYFTPDVLGASRDYRAFVDALIAP